MKHQKTTCEKCNFFSLGLCTNFGFPAKRMAELYKDELGNCKHYKVKRNERSMKTNEYTIFTVTDFQGTHIGDYNKQGLFDEFGISFDTARKHIRKNTRCKGLYYIAIKEYKTDI